jgi:CyaY protein
MITDMDERTFQQHSESAMERLTRALYDVEEAAGFDVEERGGALHLTFDEPPGTFVISPNSAPRQIWISALSTSFKLDWSDAIDDFVLSQSGEPLLPLVARLLTQQTGRAVRFGVTRRTKS